MLKSPFFRRLFLPQLLLICAAVGVVGLVGAQRLRSSFLERTNQALADETRLLVEVVTDTLQHGSVDLIHAQVHRLGQFIDRRITIIDEDGTVIADNEAPEALLENHLLRPELIAAASLGEGQSIRRSDTINEELMYYARRLDISDERTYYIRMAIHLDDLDRHLQVFYGGIALAALLAMLGAAVISYGFARRHARPLVELTRFADALRRGEFYRREVQHEYGEIGRLSQALNAMADSLSQLIGESRKDKSQLLAVLSSMGEGVIATDAQQRILFANEAAARLLQASRDDAAGKYLWEVIRTEAILVAAAEVLQSDQQRQFDIDSATGRHLEVTMCTFLGGDVEQGLVIVMRDVTEAVRYQDLRKEFVANVSHELRTPLTAIKGFAETLRDGAMHDEQRGRQYLATIEKHADQLTNLVNDLLELSRLESKPGLFVAEPVNVAEVVQKSADLLLPAAKRKEQQLSIDIPPTLPPIMGNADYLERAVTNLLENAIKYSPERGQITIAVTARSSELTLEVTDNGIGIPPADLPRIFERFYRVDRSRSREMGGTGLGLSIVKHIAQAHGGTIEVTSRPGEGSTFRLTLPILT